MYKTLTKFNKCNSIKETQTFMINKYKLDQSYFSYIIGQCVEQQLIEGIVISKSIGNHYHAVYTENIYITYNGFEFMKNYYIWIKKLLRDLFLILMTAIITVKINNWLDHSNQVHNQECQCDSNK